MRGSCVIERGCASVCFFFSSRRRHTRCREVSWARRCVQETGLQQRSTVETTQNHTGLHRCFTLVFQSLVAAGFAKVYSRWSILHSITDQNSQILSHVLCVDTVSYTHLTLPTILLVQISVVAVSLKKKKQQQPETRDERSTIRHHRRHQYITQLARAL
eukprot:TRINITY_DN29594_c0_g1_i1.p1 TRINITY_DN29594_c0_g1~~TRINITY_DN29594_c0_g1_i1.p1  ORF type:complete len:159 (-),score=24.58 TRINITY_DN29594_c0_g1_i1:10-486(-)